MIQRLSHPLGLFLAAAVILGLGWISPARAQGSDDTSREGREAGLQAEKAKALRPLTGNKAEQIILRVERTGLIGFAGPRGLYPWFGSVLGGGGVGVGGGYRFAFRDDGSANFLAGLSFKSYKLLQSNLVLPSFAGRRMKPRIDAKWIDAPKVSFYGLGNDSSKDGRMQAPAQLPAAGGEFLKIALSAVSASHPTWAQPVSAFFRRQADGWKLVGFERMP
jgi:hypothetical protein